jgi:DNA-binding IclR family transcriptional regulator
MSNAAVCRDEVAQELPLCVAEGERLGLYDVIADLGPLTAFGLAFQAMIPVSLAQRWLATQTQAGYVVRDVATGRYRTWCVVPPPEEADPS